VKRIDAYKDEIRKVYNKERERSKAALVQACWRVLSKKPPKSLLARVVGEKPTMEEAKAYVEDEIDEVLPTIDDVCDGMSVSLVIKDVTWETLNNGEFVEWLKEKYKHAKELKEPFDCRLRSFRVMATKMIARPKGQQTYILLGLNANGDEFFYTGRTGSGWVSKDREEGLHPPAAPIPVHGVEKIKYLQRPKQAHRRWQTLVRSRLGLASLRALSAPRGDYLFGGGHAGEQKPAPILTMRGNG
jgi:hypothetical protein